MAQASFRGRFVWQELMTEDPAAAAAFYTKVLGWYARASGADPSYTELGAGTHAVAGMMKLPDSAKAMGAKSAWMPYIGTDEVDPTVVEIERLGGKVVRPANDIPTVGRFAVVSDPQGAVFAVFKPMTGPAAPAAAAPKPGEFAWMELVTTDHEAAFTFYSKMFGWQALHRHDMGPMGTYLVFGSDGVQRGGMFKMSAQHGSHPYWLPYAAVADADATAKVVAASGGHVMNGPMDVPGGGRIIQITDPAGVLFAMFAQGKPEAASPAPKPAATAQTAPASKPAPTPAAAKPAAPPPKAATLAPIAARPAAPAPAAKPVPPVSSSAPKAPAAAPAAAKKSPAKKAAASKVAAKRQPAAKKKAVKKAKKSSARKAATKQRAAKSGRKKGKAKASAVRTKSARPGKRQSAKAKRKK
jgi:predicted enzyme related to lactoylglutathione lyase